MSDPAEKSVGSRAIPQLGSAQKVSQWKVGAEDKVGEDR